MSNAANISPMPQPAPTNEPLAERGIEAALLGYLLLGASPAEFSRLSHLGDDHFHEPRHKRLWAIMSELANEGISIDLATVKSRFKVITPEGEQFLLDILMQAGNNPSDYVRVLELIEWRRDVENMLKTALSLNGNRRLTDNQVATQLADMMTSLQVKIAQLTCPISYVHSDIARQQHETYAQEDVTDVGISTGYRDLDNAINGFEKGRVYAIGAGSGVGKSILLQNIAIRLNKAGQRFLIISFELPVKEYAARAISMESAIDLNVIKQHKMTPEQSERYYESLKRIANSRTPLHYTYMELPTVAQLKAKIQQVYHTYGLDGVGIDYIDSSWFTPTDKAHKSDALAFLRHIATTISVLAKEMNLYFINLVQTNRASAQRGGEPALRDFAGGSPIEHNADVAAILQDVDDTLNPDLGAVYLHILKARTGRKNQVIKLAARKEIFTFSDWNE